jgi:epoxide hydrolase-like protein
MNQIPSDEIVEGSVTSTAMTVMPPSSTSVITPFTINVPQSALDDLKRRLEMTRWSDRETVSDWSQGVPLARAPAAERRSYVLGITDGLRLAAVFNPAQVNLNPVAQGVPRLSAEHLTRRVGGHLDGLALEGDEPTLPFHVWDALVAMCRDDARNQ